MSAAFCRHLLAAYDAPLPSGAAHAARRSLLNVLGTAIGAARTTAVDALLATARDQHAKGTVAVPGRAETTDAHWGALIAGSAAHLDDYDDTHLATVIHPGAAVLATLLALEPELDVAGSRYLSAFALGCEAQLRIGNAISPRHYDLGWHITGTCGVFGSAVAAALLLGLDAAAMERAMSLAGTMILGHREAFGSMTKPFHPGKAAANGVLAARLAAAGAGGGTDPLGRAGVLEVLTDEIDRARLAGPWDRDWEVEDNAFKPYPCGIVAHPTIDAAIAASAEIADTGVITAVEVDCHPLVPELMGNRQPQDGLQARFSAYHAAAVGLIDGEASLAQFADERVTASDVVGLRALITLRPTAACARDEATLRVTRDDGPPVETHIRHARGSLDRPLTDAELISKVRKLIEPVLGAEAVDQVRDAVDALEGAPDLAALLAAIRPATGTRHTNEENNR